MDVNKYSLKKQTYNRKQHSLPHFPNVSWIGTFTIILHESYNTLHEGYKIQWLRGWQHELGRLSQDYSSYFYSFDGYSCLALLMVTPNILISSFKSYIFVFSISNTSKLCCLQLQNTSAPTIFTTGVMKIQSKLSLFSAWNTVNKFLIGHPDLDC